MLRVDRGSLADGADCACCCPMAELLCSIACCCTDDFFDTAPGGGGYKTPRWLQAVDDDPLVEMHEELPLGGGAEGSPQERV